MRERVLLICEECLSRNYTTTIKREEGKPLTIKKFCPTCGKHTFHKISK
ncbi:MAG: 50S ribosomal protein L33 [Bacilli bacterium]|nr:50S ribosomal protein L33 [Bacilli bacterium]